MRGVPRWFAVLCVVAIAVLVCAFSLRRELAPASRTVQRSLQSNPGSIAATSEFSDSFGDGTPDFFRLHDSADRAAFRGWFTLLAEAQYFRDTKLPTEINDCAALLRFSYREALRHHDSTWANGMSLPVGPRVGEVRQYHYPHTPLGAAIFRVQSGAFQPADLGTAAFAEFADAKTLWRDDTYSVGREIERARPGDLLFFRQTEGHVTYHAMIFIGRSQIEPSTQQYLVYHTGPQGNQPGEIRRLTVAELMNFPDARWRPVSSNPAFLGIYRWNILRGDQ